jgi:hypothetical protein
MKTERLLQLIGIAIFLIVTSLTYGIVSPVDNITNTLQEKSTSGITSTTANTIGDNSIITNTYRTTTAIATGGVIAVLAIHFLRPLLIENLKKKNHAGNR